MLQYFLNEANSSDKKIIETIRIGKENKNDTRTEFTLIGNIINTATGDPIANLALVVKGKKIGAVTDSKGFFKLKLPAGINLIETNSQGFETIKKRVVIYNDGRLNFDINEAYEGLEEVIIQANVDRNVKEVNTGTTQINVKEIKEYSIGTRRTGYF